MMGLVQDVLRHRYRGAIAALVVSSLAACGGSGNERGAAEPATENAPQTNAAGNAPPAHFMRVMARTGHGILYDENMNVVELDGAALNTLLLEMLKAVGNEKPTRQNAQASEIRTTTLRLLQQGNLGPGDVVAARGLVIDTSAAFLPEATEALYVWRSDILLRRYEVLNPGFTPGPDIAGLRKKYQVDIRQRGDYGRQCR